MLKPIRVGADAELARRNSQLYMPPKWPDHNSFPKGDRLKLQLEMEPIPEREGWSRLPGTTFEARFV